jgi:outer membrane protein assembly factor BamB
MKIRILFATILLSAAAPRILAQSFEEIPVQLIRVIDTQTVAEQAWDVTLSRDERNIAFVKLAETQGPSQIDSQVWIANSDGTTLKQLTSGPGFRHNPVFDPNGRFILFVKEPAQLWLVRPDGSDLHRLPVELGCTGLPAWSPDGPLIAFDIADPNKGLAIYDFQKQELVNVIQISGKTKWHRPRNLCWSPKSRKLYFLFKLKVRCLDLETGKVRTVAPAEKMASSKDGHHIVVANVRRPGKTVKWLRKTGLGRRVVGVLGLQKERVTISLLDTEESKVKYLHVNTIGLFPHPMLMTWGPSSKRLLYGHSLFDVKTKTRADLYNLTLGSGEFGIGRAFWFNGGSKIIADSTLITARMPAGKEVYRYRSIKLLSLDWNRLFASRETVENQLPVAITALAQSLPRRWAAKLLADTNDVPAATRLVCAQIHDRIQAEMLRLAFEKYPKQLEHVITQNKSVYEDPLSQFHRRLEGLSPLTGHFGKLGNEYDFEKQNLSKTRRIFGYPAPVKGGGTLSYASMRQRAWYYLKITGSDQLKKDVTELLLKELKPFFALEFLFDADLIFGFDLEESLKKVQQENTKTAAQQEAARKANSPKTDLSKEGWPKRARDAGNTAFAQDKLDLPLELKWHKTFDGRFEQISPILDQGHLYIYPRNADKTVYILDNKTADIVHQIQLDKSASTTPLVSDEYLYVLCGQRIVSAFDKSNWKLRWNAYLPGDNTAPAPTLAEGVLICANRYRYICAIDALDGKELWKNRVSSITGSPVIVDGVVIYAHGATLTARSIHDGALIWSVKFEDSRFGYRSGLSSRAGRVFGYCVRENTEPQPAYLGNLCAFDVTNGSVLWKYRIDTPYASSPVCNRNTVFIRGRGQPVVDMNTGKIIGPALHAVDINTARKKWAIPAGPPLCIIGPHLIAAVDNYVNVIDAATGKIIQKVEDRIRSGPSVGAVYYYGVLYVLGLEGDLYAFQ